MAYRLLIFVCICVYFVNANNFAEEAMVEISPQPPEGEAVLATSRSGASGRIHVPFFGIEEDFNKENDIFSLSSKDLRELNVKIVRTHGGPFVWNSIEPRKGEFDFTTTDKAVREAFYSGVSIIASLWPYALWDQGNIESCEVSGKIDAMRGRVPNYRCKPQDMKAYRSFLRELVERYDGDDDFGSQPISDDLKEIIRRNPIIYWEIDNEVDAGDNKEYAKFFVGSLEDYFDLLKNSYEAIKEANEECQVVVAAPAGSIRDYYSHLFSLGAKDYFDVYNLHGPIQELRETVGSLDKPVFITEAGGKEGAELAKEAILLASEGVTLAILNMVPDWPKYYTKNIGGDPQKEEEFFKGYLLSKDGSKASAYYVLQTLSTELEYFNPTDVDFDITNPNGIEKQLLPVKLNIASDKDTQKHEPSSHSEKKQPSSSSGKPRPTADAVGLSRSKYQVIVENNLFRPLGWQEEVVKKTTPITETIVVETHRERPAPTYNLTLTGIAQDGSQRIAIVEDETKKEGYFLHRGEKLKDALVSEISEKHIVLVQGDTQAQLSLGESIQYDANGQILLDTIANQKPALEHSEGKFPSLLIPNSEFRIPNPGEDTTKSLIERMKDRRRKELEQE